MRGGRNSAGAGRWLRSAVYWLAVVAVSVALVVTFLLLLESCDASTVGA